MKMLSTLICFFMISSSFTLVTGSKRQNDITKTTYDGEDHQNALGSGSSEIAVSQDETSLHSDGSTSTPHSFSEVNTNILKQPSSTDASSFYVPGEILVKFNTNFFKETSGSLLTAIQSITDSTYMSITSAQQLFSQFILNKNTEQKNSQGLSRWVKLTVPTTTDIPTEVQKYQENAFVEYAQPNYIMNAYLTPNDPYYASSGSWGQDFQDLWGLHRIDTSSAWDITTGSTDIVVAVIDTGVDYNHPDIAANMWINTDEIPGNGIDDDNDGFIDNIYGADFRNNDGDPLDGGGHGTHCAGIISAVGNNDLGVVGVNWQTKIMAVKGLSNGGSGSSDTLAAALIWAADQGADVLSDSWGVSIRTPSLPVMEDAVHYADNLGCVVVFAAGNSYDDVQYICPQNMPEVITVAAIDPYGNQATFTNWGEQVAVCAPGVDILSLRANGTDMYGDGTHIVGENYMYASGTSMACPHVAGLAALLLAANPTLTPDVIKTVMQQTGDQVDSRRPIGPLINAGDALFGVKRGVAWFDLPDYANVSGIITILGTANGTLFESYALEYGEGYAPTTWTMIATSTTPITDGTLGSLDVTGLPEGTYMVRLQVMYDGGLVKTLNHLMVVNNEHNQYIVDDDGGSGVDFLHIQDAVLVSGKNDEIFVRNGVYHESIRVDRPVQLIGENNQMTILDGGNASHIMVFVTAEDVTMQGFTLRNSGQNTSLYNLDYGILVWGDADSIIGNRFSHIPVDIALYESKNSMVADNEIEGIEDGAGIYLSASSENRILRNNVSNAAIEIIFWFGDDNNKIENNSLSGMYTYGSAGITVYQCSYRNIFKNNVMINHQWGMSIYYWSRENMFMNNLIKENSLYGVAIAFVADNNTFAENNIISNGNYGINLPPDLGGISGHYNLFYRNNFIENGINAVDPSYNTWYNGSLQEGNYWSDYLDRYPDAQERVDLPGRWNKPYVIPQGANRDRYPLVISFGPNYPPNMPNNPYPADGQTEVFPTADLTWRGGDPNPGDSATYDVYFGTELPLPKVSSNQSYALFSPEVMQFDTTYYWQIIAWDRRNASATGPVWTFTTGEIDVPPSIYFVPPTPENGTTQANHSIPVNITVNENHVFYTVVDFNHDICLWMRMDDLSQNGEDIIVNDLSSYHNDGTIRGDAQITGNGYFGKAASFDGAGDYIEIPDSPSLDLSTTISISAWFKVVNPLHRQVIAAKTAGADNTWILEVSSYGELTFYLNAGGTDTNLYSNTILNPETWYHVVAVYDGSTRMIYINGVLDASVSDSGSIYLNNRSVTIGDWSSHDRPFTGSIDEVMIFNHALNPDEIRTLYDGKTNRYLHTFTGLSLGSYTFTGYAVDQIGNKNQTETRQVLINVNQLPYPPSNPSPVNGAVGVSDTADLSWTGGDPDVGDSVTYDVYFSHTNPPAKVASNISIATYDPGTLSFNYVYYWRIVSWDTSHESRTGNVWSFTTRGNSAPYPPSNPDPSNGAVNVSRIIELSWTGGDPDGDPCTYDIYFGTTNPPPFLLWDNPTNTYNPGFLNSNTTYYWKIRSYDGHIHTTGPVWMFTTGWGTETIPPSISFIAPTPENNSVQQDHNIPVCLSTSDEHRTYTLLDFNHDLRLWMRMDDVSTSREGPTVYDLSSYQNNGVACGNAEQTNGSFYGKGFSFGGPDGYINISDSPSLDITQNISISAWFKSSDKYERQVIVAKTAGGDNTWLLEYDWGDVNFYLNAGGTASDLVAPTEIDEDTWCHVVAVYNGSKRMIYLNGVLDASISDSGSINLNNRSVTIGDWSSHDRQFYGFIDEVMIFSRGLSSDEVKALYNSKVSNYARTFTNLPYDSYMFTGYAVDLAGNMNQTETRTVLISTDQPPNQPSNPNPLHKETSVSVSTDISWVGGDPDPEDTVLYDVYFGISNPPQLVAYHQAETIYDPGTLNSDSIYYWRIVSWDDIGAKTTGALWYFKTGVNQPPYPPSSPLPLNGAINVLTNTILSWTGGDPDGDLCTYDVYFSVNNPPEKIADNVSTTAFSPGILGYNTTYYWQVVTWDYFGISTSGLLWSFTTTSNHPPYPASNPSPANGTINVAQNADLSWAGGDPDAIDTVTYDVYFGTSNPPTKVKSNQSATVYDPGMMLSNTTYYWMIVSWDNHGASTDGPTWTYKTKINHAPYVPSYLLPSNGSTGISLTPILLWDDLDPDGDPLTFDVYFGASNPPPKIVSNQTDIAYLCCQLNFNTTYYWKIVAWDNHGASTPGPIWNFKTRPNHPPNPANNPFPMNNSVTVPPTVDLTWTGGGDPDGDSITYNVSFGTTNPPPQQTSGQISTYYDPGQLSLSTTYYWRITTKDYYGASTYGPLWMFTTSSTPDTTPPSIQFASPTPDNGTAVHTLPINLTISDEENYYSFVNLNHDLRLWMRMDDVSSSGEGATVYDISGYQNNGLAHGNAKQVNHGYAGKGFTFDGSGDYITIPDSSSLDISQTITISTWFKTTTTSGTQIIAAKSTSTDVTWYVEIFASRIYFYLNAGGQSSHVSSTPISKNTLYHVVAVYNGSKLMIYINGVLDESYSKSGSINLNNQNVTIGDWSSHNHPFSGMIDEVLIFNRALGSDEIKTLYNGRQNHFLHTYKNIPVGLNSFTGYTADQAGNKNQTETRYVTIVNQPPNPPSSPNPPNGTTDTDIIVYLSWSGGDPDNDACKYDVYLGTTDPPPKIISNQTATIIQRTLNFNTTYYWQIISWDSYGTSTQGPIWNFRTRINHPPNPATDPYPANNSLNIQPNIDLLWTGGGDPDGDTISYDVYFGTVNPPPQQTTGQTSNFYDPGLLNLSTTYYWQITTKDFYGASTSGPLWTFTTSSTPDTAPPAIQFAPPTPENGTTTHNLPVNLTITDEENYYAFVDLNHDLRLWMRMDDASTSGEGATVYDLSSYQNNGTAHGNAKQSSHGYAGKGFTFDGTGDYITIPDSSSLDITNSITISAWFKTTTTNKYHQYIASKTEEGLSTSWSLALQFGSVEFYIKTEESSFYAYSPMQVTPGVWYHVTGIYDGNIQQMYINGVFAVSNSISGPLLPNNGNVQVGNSSKSNYPFYGDIDEVLIFNRALSPEEITMLFNGNANHYLHTFTGLPIGITNFTGYAVDQAGNKNQTETRYVTIENQPPNTPSNPAPAHEAIDVITTADLSWTGEDPDNDPLTYDVYFGVTPQPPLIITNIPTATYNPGKMDTYTTYYWQITSRDETGESTTGPIWTFTTGLDDTTPPTISFADPTPQNNTIQTDHAITVNLTASDQDVFYSFVDFNHNLRLWMCMDDATEGNVYDSSSYHNDGNITGDTYQTDQGYYGKAMVFDGSGDYITIPDSTSLDITKNITVSAWIKASSISRRQVIAAKTAGGDNTWLLEIQSSNKINFYLNAGGTASDFISNTIINANLWYHIAAVYNGSKRILYINGERDNMLDDSGALYVNNRDVTIGDWSSHDRPFNGTIDEVMIFNRGLAPEEIKTLYNGKANHYQHTFTNLPYDSYTFTGYAVDEIGNRNQTETRHVTISMILPPTTPIHVADGCHTHTHPNDMNKGIGKLRINQPGGVIQTFTITSDNSGDVQYKIYFGDGSDSGWITPIDGVATTTHDYSALGNFTAYGICKIGAVESAPGPSIIVRMYLLGDINGDTQVDFGDINPFVLMLSSGKTGFYNSFPNAYYYTGDINSDCTVNFGDINPFVALLTGTS